MAAVGQVKRNHVSYFRHDACGAEWTIPLDVEVATCPNCDQSIRRRLHEQRWESDEPFDQEQRWRLGYRDGDRYFHTEADSLLSVLRTMATAWRRLR